MKNVYALISAVTADLKGSGIQKDRRNQQQGYSFRGIDDVFNALAPALSRHGLVIMPRCVARTVTERANKQGGLLFSVTVEVEFDFVSAHDGTTHSVRFFGEAMDSGDKATNKAMSAAYKYCALQVFCIPTEGDNDSDATTHEVNDKPDFTALFAEIEKSTNREELSAIWSRVAPMQKTWPEEYQRLKKEAIAKGNTFTEQKSAAANE